MSKRYPNSFPIVIGSPPDLRYAFRQVCTSPDYCWKTLTPFSTVQAIQNYPPFRGLPIHHELIQVYYEMRKDEHSKYMRSQL